MSWPKPLLAFQQTSIEELDRLRATEHYPAMLAVIKCGTCSRPVGDLRMFYLPLPDQPGKIGDWRGGAVLIGTRKRDIDAVRREIEAIRQFGEGDWRDAPRNDQYSALIERNGLPGQLPFYCDRDQHLSVALTKLRSVVGEHLAGRQSPDDDPAVIWARPPLTGVRDRRPRRS